MQRKGGKIILKDLALPFMASGEAAKTTTTIISHSPLSQEIEIEKTKALPTTEASLTEVKRIDFAGYTLAGAPIYEMVFSGNSSYISPVGRPVNPMPDEEEEEEEAVQAIASIDRTHYGTPPEILKAVTEARTMAEGGNYCGEPAPTQIVPPKPGKLVRTFSVWLQEMKTYCSDGEKDRVKIPGELVREKFKRKRGGTSSDVEYISGKELREKLQNMLKKRRIENTKRISRLRSLKLKKRVSDRAQNDDEDCIFCDNY